MVYMLIDEDESLVVYHKSEIYRASFHLFTVPSEKLTRSEKLHLVERFTNSYVH